MKIVTVLNRWLLTNARGGMTKQQRVNPSISSSITMMPMHNRDRRSPKERRGNTCRLRYRSKNRMNYKTQCKKQNKLVRLIPFFPQVCISHLINATMLHQSGEQILEKTSRRLTRSSNRPRYSLKFKQSLSVQEKEWRLLVWKNRSILKQLQISI